MRGATATTSGWVGWWRAGPGCSWSRIAEGHNYDGALGALLDAGVNGGAAVTNAAVTNGAVTDGGAVNDGGAVTNAALLKRALRSFGLKALKALEVRALPAAIRDRGLDFTLTVGAVQKYIGWVRSKPPGEEPFDEAAVYREMRERREEDERIRAAIAAEPPGPTLVERLNAMRHNGTAPEAAP
jgi:hypothetical protein